MLKKLINRKTVLLTTTLVVLIITLITVTIAWFESSVFVNSDENSMSTAKWDFVVSLTPGGLPVTETDKISLDVGTFTNVKEGMLAPGTSGAFKLYITSNSDVASGYQIAIDKRNLKLIVTSAEGTTQDYSNILQSHIIFYTLDDENRKVIINETQLAKGELVQGVEKEVTIHWEWLYEADVSNILEEERKEEAIKQYDQEDTLIGENKDFISGGIIVNVQGSQFEPTNP